MPELGDHLSDEDKQRIKARTIDAATTLQLIATDDSTDAFASIADACTPDPDDDAA